MHFDCFTKWNHKVAWIRSLTSRAKRLCSYNKLSEEIKNIRRFASYNGFPRWTVNKIIKEALSNQQKHQTTAEEQDQEEVHSLYMFLPYAGREAEQVVIRCKKRLAMLFKKEVKVLFKIQFQATKLSFYTSNKDRIPLLSNSSLVYRFTCPGCSKSYIGKTETTLFNRTKQHGWCDKKSAVYNHLGSCPHWNEIVGLLQINGEAIDTMNLQINAVRDNTEIIRRSDNWLKLAFLESLCIKEYRPELNSGIKSCKDLALF